MAQEPLITFPTCNPEIKLTESLAAPLIESAREMYQQRLAEQHADIAKRGQAIREAEEHLSLKVLEPTPLT